jgi:NTE family protein
VDDVALLAGVPLFAGLASDLLKQLAAAAETEYVRAGELLFAQGDAGDALYVVRSGRVEVLVDDEVVRVHGRGEAFGELALLSGGVRTASVRARRDSELLAVNRAEFDHLLATQPAFSHALIRELGLRLRRGDVPPPRPPATTVFALVAVQPSLPDRVGYDLAELLCRELRLFGRVARLDGDGEPATWAARVDVAEAAHDTVLLVAPDAEAAWVQFCLRQADRTLALVDPALGGAAAGSDVRGCELVALGTRGLAAWLDGVAAHHLIDITGPGEDVARLARRLSGRALGLVLSGGGSRGLAHIGVIDVLRREGARIDRVGGTSMGSFVSGLVALGLSTDEMLDVVRRELVTRRPFSDYTWPRHSLIRAARARAMLGRVFGDARIEDQRVSMFCVSVDLVRAEEVVHRRGRIADAVGLSMRLPGVAPPEWVGSRLHIDGGVLDNLPIAAMAADGQGPVIAVDVMRPFAPAPGTRPGDNLPMIVDTIGRAMVLASWQRAESGRALAHTLVTPALEGIGMFDFRRLDEIVDIGRRAAEDALPAMRELLKT